MKQQAKRRGFTIIELTVVIIVIGLLVGIAIAGWGSWKKTVTEKNVRSDLSNVYNAMQNSRNFNDGYPSLTVGSTFDSTGPSTNQDLYLSSSDVKLTYSSGTSSTFCIDGVSRTLANIILFVKEDGSVKKGTCAGGEIVDFPGSSGFGSYSQVAVGLQSACGIASGKVYCWGNNSNGELGNNSTTRSLVPVAVDTSGVLAGKTITAVDVGSGYACAIASGAVYCWGKNTQGQLGNNSLTNSLVPVAVNTSGVLSGQTVTAVSTGLLSTCALASGAAYCWGDNQQGELGNNTVTDSSIPVAVTTSGVLSGKTVTAISTNSTTSANSTTCAIASGAAYCWGTNGASGSVGNNTTTTKYKVPTTVTASGVLSGKTVTSISGGNTSCVVADGKAYCWGANTTGQVGNNSTTDSLVPVAVDATGVLSGKTVTKISSATNATCAVADGKAYCWGAYGASATIQLMTGNSIGGSVVPVAVDTSGVLSDKTVTSIKVGTNSQTVCSLADNFSVCWGGNPQGAFGNNTSTGSYLPVQSNNS